MKTVKRILCLLLVAAFLLSTPMTAFAEPAEDLFLIATKEDLDDVRNHLDADFKLVADIEFAPEDFAEGGDFYHGGAGWQPIGANWAESFTGSFDGNGHTIKGLQSNITGNDDVYAGLFGYAQNCEIKNLGLLDCEIQATSDSDSVCVGGIVGRAVDATIVGCYNTGSVTATSESSSCKVGGIVGYACGKTITDCQNTGNVSVAGEGSYAWIGGIVGFSHNVIASNCSNTGSVTATDVDNNIGGIAGCFYGGATDAAITDCCNTGSVKGSAISGWNYTGGIVGLVSYTDAGLTITNCYNDGSVEAVSLASNAAVGGIVGAPIGKTTITDCSNTGSVTATALVGVARVGGIAGSPSDSKMMHCCNTGDVTATSGSYVAIAGGILGESSDCSVTNCCNTGSVTATSEQRDASAGGIAGHAFVSNTILNCYNTGSVTATSGSSTTAGGIVGNNTDSSAANCYNTGDVTAASDSNTAYAGGILGGSSNGFVTNCCNTGSVTATAEQFAASAGGIAGEAFESNTIASCCNTGDVTATSDSYAANSGGILGQSSGGAVTNCCNTGDVTATSDSHVANAGGILGESSGGSVTNCYNTGDVTATSDSHIAYAGGIVGYVSDFFSNGDMVITIRSCYNTGGVTMNSKAYDAYIGGIVGYADDSHARITITDCYYLDNIGHGIGAGSGSTIACTAEEMEKQETFAGFDFDMVWTMEGDTDYPLPELRAVPMVLADKLVDVSIAALPKKLTYMVADSLNVSGGMLKATYSDGTYDEIPMSHCLIIGFDNTMPGKQTLTVFYGGYIVTYEVEVKMPAFIDIPENAWYVDAVQYAVAHGLMKGVAEDRFAPNKSMTRAMLVTVPWRMEDQPMGCENTFSDVNAESGGWYIDAVAWAAANGIVGGVGDNRFAPNGSITREQMATILFRYANKKGLDTSARSDLGSFTDASTISGYAVEAMQWAVGEGIINGSNGILMPRGSATRAQIAAILMRFIKGNT